MAERGTTSARLMVLGALGVVFGDIGTSPLYAMRTVLGESSHLTPAVVYGMTSTVIWSMVLVVSVLYVGLLLRTDNEGEGGLLALVALLRRTVAGHRAAAVSVLGMVGAAMFLGDSVITPAISVLSAAEGLEVANPSLKAAVVPIAFVLLAGVFVVQRYGSGRIGRFYGPLMLVWFVVIAAAGVGSIASGPAALQTLSPHWAVHFFVTEPRTAFLSLGSVVLAVTGAEALYADLGHFGRPAITRAWLFVVFPALVLAYVGEASEVVRDPTAAANPFYAVMPGWATIPVLVISTLATVIASQAVIAGTFTVLHQASGLGLFPPLRTEHTSREHSGQIYLPAANWTLAFAVLGVVAGFRGSDALSSAYGVAVTATITVTASLYLWLSRLRGPYGALRAVVTAGVLVVVLAFLAACLPKILTGGWLPLGIGVVMFLLMSSWWSGRRRLAAARHEAEPPLAEVLAPVREGAAVPVRVDGTAVFLTHDTSVAPLALRTMVEQNHVLHRTAVLLAWDLADTPASPADTSVELDPLDDRYDGVVAVRATFGYRERPDLRRVLAGARQRDPERLVDLDPDTVVFFVSVPIPMLSRRGGMARWRQRVFLLVDRLATDPVEQLRLPRDRTVVLGRELTL
ncbi:potassium transporter Kup [Nocardioides ungokensis]|uniref:potassium transporter Kup n=1 Tax=Nocardioides ungokensis TaxID=1643322 RepID=UPI0015E0430B|nr:KUP/HAK/KT family potassium transporter [Nocardioides ungokensis]